jgi:hypothetical protein
MSKRVHNIINGIAVTILFLDKIVRPIALVFLGYVIGTHPEAFHL